MTDEVSSNTAKKQRGNPFTKGDPRINRKGRPKTFDQLRALALQISHEVLKDAEGNDAGTRVELKLREWFDSADARLQLQAMAYAFGKVPEPVEIGGKDGNAIVLRVEYGDDRTNDTATETT